MTANPVSSSGNPQPPPKPPKPPVTNNPQSTLEHDGLSYNPSQSRGTGGQSSSGSSGGSDGGYTRPRSPLDDHLAESEYIGRGKKGNLSPQQLEDIERGQHYRTSDMFDNDPAMDRYAPKGPLDPRYNDVRTLPPGKTQPFGKTTQFGKATVPKSMAQDYQAAREHMMQSETGKRYLAAFEQQGSPKTIVPDTESKGPLMTPRVNWLPDSDTHTPVSQQVRWGPRQAMLTPTGDKLSPATIAAHEMAHAVRASAVSMDDQHNLDRANPLKGYTNMEEHHVISGPEHDVAKANGEGGGRDSHGTAGMYETDGPRSTTPVNPKAKSIIDHQAPLLKEATRAMDIHGVSPKDPQLTGKDLREAGLDPNDRELLASERAGKNAMAHRDALAEQSREALNQIKARQTGMSAESSGRKSQSQFASDPAKSKQPAGGIGADGGTKAAATGEQAKPAAKTPDTQPAAKTNPPGADTKQPSGGVAGDGGKTNPSGSKDDAATKAAGADNKQPAGGVGADGGTKATPSGQGGDKTKSTADAATKAVEDTLKAGGTEEAAAKAGAEAAKTAARGLGAAGKALGPAGLVASEAAAVIPDILDIVHAAKAGDKHGEAVAGGLLAADLLTGGLASLFKQWADGDHAYHDDEQPDGSHSADYYDPHGTDSLINN